MIKFKTEHVFCPATAPASVAHQCYDAKLDLMSKHALLFAIGCLRFLALWMLFQILTIIGMRLSTNLWFRSIACLILAYPFAVLCSPCLYFGFHFWFGTTSAEGITNTITMALPITAGAYAPTRQLFIF